MSRWLAVCVAGLAALVSFGRAAEPDPPGLDAASVLALLEQHHVPGVSIAIIKDFKIAWTGTYGTADVVTGAAVDADTAFQAASISKPVAAMAVLKAVSDLKMRTAFITIYSAGLRVSEAVALTARDIDSARDVQLTTVDLDTLGAQAGANGNSPAFHFELLDDRIRVDVDPWSASNAATSARSGS